MPVDWFPSHNRPTDVWERWLTSEAPRLFESGKIGTREFAARVVNDFELSVSDAEFLDYFKDLPESLYDGATALLNELQQTYTTACFSNSNELHWDHKLTELGLMNCFEYHFASHLMGFVKPDVQGFQHVLSQLNVQPECVLFFDDNLLNVNSARSVGMKAEHVNGICELRNVLSQLHD